ncbi:MAG: hypothetical protein ABW185_08540 [Sedimenticola sp.]
MEPVRSIIRSVTYEFIFCQQDAESGDSDVSDHAQPEFWDNISEEELCHDIQRAQDTPLPEPPHTVKQQAMAVTHWVLYCLMFLQCLHIIGNNCLVNILILIKHIFTMLSEDSQLCAGIASIFPVTLYMVWKIVKFERDDFLKYVVCPNCSAIFEYNSIVKKTLDGTLYASTCTNIVFGSKVSKDSNNRRKRGKFKCCEKLVKEVILDNGKKLFYPIKVYCYRGITDSLATLLRRPTFEELCRQWQTRDVPNGHYADVYDGNVWKDFVKFNGEDFLAKSYHYGIMVNVDWFQPFKRRSDISIGVIYTVILNLPRNVRFKKENVILVGIIPAMNKEPSELNNFIDPLVNELKLLWKGVNFTPYGTTSVITAKVVLLCAASDIPAARKLCGFMGHAAIQGCSFCSKSFRNSSGERSLAGFDVENWQKRNRADHIKFGKRAKHAKTICEKKNIEKMSGYKFTPFLELDYFEPSKFCIVDPMHNLFLGTAKRMFSTWVDSDILSKSDLQTIGNKIKQVTIATDIGRIPCNIATNHGHFTAQEWKNWVLVYSMFVLQGVLEERYLRHWQKFVIASLHICKPCISSRSVTIAHTCFVSFCQKAEELYGPSFITPNMHLHCHLKDSIESFGSIYGFWLFSFERYNGILTSFPNNKKSVEVQLIRKFLQFGFMSDVQCKDMQLQAHFRKFVTDVSDDEPTVATLSFEVSLAQQIPIAQISTDVWGDLSCISIRHNAYTLFTMTNTLREQLKAMYSVIYGFECTDTAVGGVCKRFQCMYMNNDLYGSSNSARYNSYCMVMAKWSTEQGTISCEEATRPGKVKQYMLHSLCMNNKFVDHVIAVVEWLKLPNDSDRELHWNPITVWSTKSTNAGPSTCIPVQRIVGRCAWATQGKGSQKHHVVCPIPHSLYL